MIDRFEVGKWYVFAGLSYITLMKIKKIDKSLVTYLQIEIDTNRKTSGGIGTFDLMLQSGSRRLRMFDVLKPKHKKEAFRKIFS